MLSEGSMDGGMVMKRVCKVISTAAGGEQWKLCLLKLFYDLKSYFENRLNFNLMYVWILNELIV